MKQQINDLQVKLSDHQLAVLLGVPLSTLRKWSAGTREPNAAAKRLIEVLSMVETLTPEVYASLIPARDAVEPKRKRSKG